MLFAAKFKVSVEFEEKYYFSSPPTINFAAIYTNLQFNWNLNPALSLIVRRVAI